MPLLVAALARYQVLNAILWKLRIGAPRRDLPTRYEPWKTVRDRLR